MATYEPRIPRRPGQGFSLLGASLGSLAVVGLGALIAVFFLYQSCKIEVRQGEQAVLIRLVGLDLEPGMEVAPAYSKEKGYYKGVQPGVLTEGRYFYNPFYWDWEIGKQFLVPEGKCAVRIDLIGEELPDGQILAEEGQKGIRTGVIEAGARVPYNPYVTSFEIVDPIEVYPGGRGVVTLLAGTLPKTPNTVLVEPGERGVQKETLPPGRYFINPYERRVSVVDCRTQRFQLSQDSDISFLSADGFSISVDGVVAFRVKEEKAAEVYVLYNEAENGDVIEEELIKKVVTPSTRSICRTNGSKLEAVQFLSGDDKAIFQENLQKSLAAQCEQQGIEIISVAITGTQAPVEIQEPVMAREEAKQQLDQYLQQKIEQEAQAQYRSQSMLAEQKSRLVDAERQVVELTIKAETEQDVAKREAEKGLSVAQTKLEAAKDQAAALLSEAEANASVIRFKNTAELAGVRTRVQAFSGDGGSLAQNMMIGKLAPAYRTILSNSEGPLMQLFEQFGQPASLSSSPATARAPFRPLPPPADPANPSTAADPSAGTDNLPTAPFADPNSTPSEAGR